MKKVIIYSFVLIILVCSSLHTKAQTVNPDDLLGFWDFEKVINPSIYLSAEKRKEITATFKGAEFYFGDDATYKLEFANGYKLEGGYEWEDDTKLTLGTKQDGSEMNNFFDSYVYQLVFSDKEHFTLKFYTTSFEEDPIYQMQFKRYKF